MKLPPLVDPRRYVGLFVYDFGARVSVGYTAGEVAALLRSQEHADGTVYQIIRASEDGALDLRGVDVAGLLGREAFICLRSEPAAATADFDQLRKAASAIPVPTRVELILARVYALDPPHATALLYPSACAGSVLSWLANSGFDGGDAVRVDRAAVVALEAEDTVRIASEILPGLMDYSDRTEEELLASMQFSVQR